MKADSLSPNASNCPHPNQLAAHAVGKLDEDLAHTIELHMKDCLRCCNAIEKLSVERDPMRAILGSQDPRPDSWKEPQCDLASLRARDIHLGPCRAQAEGKTWTLRDVHLEHVVLPSSKPGCIGLLGRYEVEEIIGRGGMGIVLKAYDPGLRCTVAIKLVRPELATNPIIRERFIAEARNLAQVQDPNVIVIHGVNDNPTLPWFVMRYVPGLTLKARIKNGALSPRQILQIACEAASGLKAIHARNLIHRDIKPENVFLEDGLERAVILDFGLTRGKDDPRVTSPGEIVGTPAYMSPEQALERDLDPRSDLFSFGGMLYAMCTRKPPFEARSTAEVIQKVIKDPPPPIRETRSDIPEWLTRIVVKLMTKNPADRLPSSETLAKLLGRLRDMANTSDLENPESEEEANRILMEHGVVDPSPPAWWWYVLPILGIVVAMIVIGLVFMNGRAQSPDLAPSVPITSPPGFVVIHQGNPLEETFDSLQAAVHRAPPESTIEISGDEILLPDPITIDKPLTLRAAPGSHPVIELHPDQTGIARPVLKAESQLTLEGLEICRKGSWTGARYLILATKANFFAANCRFAIGPGTGDCVHSNDSPLIGFANCAFLGSGKGHGVSWHAPDSGKLSLENCVQVGGSAVHLYHPFPRSNATLSIGRSTILGSELVVAFFEYRAVFPPEKLDSAPIRVQLRSTVVDPKSAVLKFGLDKWKEDLLQGKLNVAQRIKESIAWSFQSNVFGIRRQRYLEVRDCQPVTSLTAWKEFWADPGNKDIERSLSYRGANEKSTTDWLVRDDPWVLQGEDFSIAKPLPDSGVGFDWTTLGPKAYSTWKQTEEYQTWLKATGQDHSFNASPKSR